MKAFFEKTLLKIHFENSNTVYIALQGFTRWADEKSVFIFRLKNIQIKKISSQIPIVIF